MKPIIFRIFFRPTGVTIKGKKALGICKFYDGVTDIYVDPSLSWAKRVLVLMHELAHAAFDLLGPSTDLSRDNLEYFADSVGSRAEQAFMEVIDRSNN